MKPTRLDFKPFTCSPLTWPDNISALSMFNYILLHVLAAGLQSLVHSCAEWRVQLPVIALPGPV